LGHVFDIRFVASQPESLAEYVGSGASGLRGQIVLDDFSEEFVALLGPWGREDYERHWAEAAARITGGADRTAFFSSAFEFRWTMWRLGDELRVQEHYLGAAEFPETFHPSDLYGSIRDYTNATEDGRVSEWILPVEALVDFIRRADAGEAVAAPDAPGR
jgi:hypothetical protein